MLLFIDFEKAFDTYFRMAIFRKTLRFYNFGDSLRSLKTVSSTFQGLDFDVSL